MDVKSIVYGDKGSKKLRIISKICAVLSFLLLVVLIIIWKDEYSEVKEFTFKTLFEMPYIIIIGCVLLFIASIILNYIASIKTYVKGIKNLDNTFLK